MGEGGRPILKSKHGDATNFPPAAACILGARVRRKRHQAWCWCSGRMSSGSVCGKKPIFGSSGTQKVRHMAILVFQDSVFWSETYFREHDWADSFVACTCFYIAEDAEYSEACFHWPV